MEEDLSRSVPDGSQSQVSGEGQMDPTRQHSPAYESYQNRPSHNLQSLTGPNFVPSVTPNRQVMNQALITPSIPAPAITASAENNEANRLMISQPVTQQSTLYPLLIPNNNIPDNHLIGQSLPNNNQSLPNNNHSFTSLSYSPFITESLTQNPTHHFSFNANHIPNPKPAANTLTRTRPTLTRTDPKPDPLTPAPSLNQILPVSMEVQTEKKEEGTMKRKLKVL
jgi:hypothetical protein